MNAAGIAGGITAAQARTLIADWAEHGDTDPIPANKLTLAGGSALNAEQQVQLADLVRFQDDGMRYEEPVFANRVAHVTAALSISPELSRDATLPGLIYGTEGVVRTWPNDEEMTVRVGTGSTGTEHKFRRQDFEDLPILAGPSTAFKDSDAITWTVGAVKFYFGKVYLRDPANPPDPGHRQVNYAFSASVIGTYSVTLSHRFVDLFNWVRPSTSGTGDIGAVRDAGFFIPWNRIGYSDGTGPSTGQVVLDGARIPWLDQLQVDARVAQGRPTQYWARSGNTQPIPQEKLVNVPLHFEINKTTEVSFQAALVGEDIEYGGPTLIGTAAFTLEGTTFTLLRVAQDNDLSSQGGFSYRKLRFWFPPLSPAQYAILNKYYMRIANSNTPPVYNEFPFKHRQNGSDNRVRRPYSSSFEFHTNTASVLKVGSNTIEFWKEAEVDNFLPLGGTPGQVVSPKTGGGREWIDPTAGIGAAATWARTGNTDAIPNNKLSTKLHNIIEGFEGDELWEMVSDRWINPALNTRAGATLSIRGLTSNDASYVNDYGPGTHSTNRSLLIRIPKSNKLPFKDIRLFAGADSAISPAEFEGDSRVRGPIIHGRTVGIFANWDFYWVDLDDIPAGTRFTMQTRDRLELDPDYFDISNLIPHGAQLFTELFDSSFTYEITTNINSKSGLQAFTTPYTLGADDHGVILVSGRPSSRSGSATTVPDESFSAQVFLSDVRASTAFLFSQTNGVKAISTTVLDSAGAVTEGECSVYIAKNDSGQVAFYVNYVAAGTATSVSGGVIWTLEISLLRTDTRPLPAAPTYTARGPLIGVSKAFETTGGTAPASGYVGDSLWSATNPIDDTAFPNSPILGGTAYMAIPAVTPDPQITGIWVVAERALDPTKPTEFTEQGAVLMTFGEFSALGTTDRLQKFYPLTINAATGSPSLNNDAILAFVQYYVYTPNGTTNLTFHRYKDQNAGARTRLRFYWAGIYTS